MSPFDAGLPTSKKRRGRSWLSPIWLVPVMAAAAVGYLAHRQFVEKGPTIEIEFREADGLEAGKTDLRYRGVKMGEVTKLSLSDDLRRVVAEVELAGSAGPLAREGSRFWIVKPRVSPTGVSGLGTIITGAYIEAAPGRGDDARRFTALEQPPSPQAERGALEVFVTAERLPSLEPGSSVYYRNLAVGSVAETALAPDGRGVRIRLLIDKPYRPLVSAASRFWNAGGLDVKFSLLHGAQIKARSLGSAVEGGIAFATPDPPGPPAKKGQTYPLADKPDEAWLKWAPAVKLPERAP